MSRPFQIKMIRHNRILDLRKKIQNGWTLEQLKDYCLNNLKVSKPTADSYIEEAAAPFRKKYQEQQNVN